jgi:hypothetical protein
VTRACLATPLGEASPGREDRRGARDGGGVAFALQRAAAAWIASIGPTDQIRARPARAIGRGDRHDIGGRCNLPAEVGRSAPAIDSTTADED